MPIDPLPNSPATLDTDSMRNKINELIGNNASVTVSNSPPTGPAEGDLWFDEGSAAMYVYVAAPTNAWIQTNPASTSGSGGGGGGGGSAATIIAHESNQYTGGGGYTSDNLNYPLVHHLRTNQTDVNGQYVGGPVFLNNTSSCIILSSIHQADNTTGGTQLLGIERRLRLVGSWKSSSTQAGGVVNAQLYYGMNESVGVSMPHPNDAIKLSAYGQATPDYYQRLVIVAPGMYFWVNNTVHTSSNASGIYFSSELKIHESWGGFSADDINAAHIGGSLNSLFTGSSSYSGAIPSVGRLTQV